MNNANASEMTKHRELCLAVLLLFLGSVASVVPSLHVETGAYSYLYNDVYEERREPELHFQRLSEADQFGKYRFLYTDSRRPNTWILGAGVNVTTARAEFRAPAVYGRPPITGWSDVWDESREGGEEGIPEPEIRVVGVETKITGEELRKQLEKRGEDVVTEEYTICDAPGSSKIKRNIFLKSLDCVRCNQVPDCASKIDEQGCPAYTSPSFEYPIYCSLVVLILGVLLHLGWNAVTR